MTSRFSYEAPGLLRSAWYAAFNDWEEKIRPWVTDHERGECFQLTEDEELMMKALSENMDALADQQKVSFWKLHAFWTKRRIDLAKDAVLAAISDRHHGSTKEWDRLKAMTPDEWIDWLGIVGRTDVSPHS